MRALFLILILLLSPAFPAVDGLKPDGSLDRSKISKAYFEGDFDMVVDALEAFRKMQPNPTREDRIYVYKYLSVIYAAKPETRAKAESYMYQLLKIMPSIELMDLYISDNIEAIFNNVRMRFEHQQRLGLDSGKANPAQPAAAAVSAPAPSQSPGTPAANAKPAGKRPSGDKESSSWVWWTAGAFGVAAAVTGYVLLSQTPARAAAPNDTVVLK